MFANVERPAGAHLAHPQLNLVRLNAFANHAHNSRRGLVSSPFCFMPCPMKSGCAPQDSRTGRLQREGLSERCSAMSKTCPRLACGARACPPICPSGAPPPCLRRSLLAARHHQDITRRKPWAICGLPTFGNMRYLME